MQIEIKRSLCMDAQLQAQAGLDRLKAAIDDMLAALAAHATALRAPV